MENRDPINLKLLRRVLTLVFIVFAIFYIGGPPALAYLFPWEPPVSDEGVNGSVLRVIVPEGEPYEIFFYSTDSAPDSVRGVVPNGEFYVDHPVRPRAQSSGYDDYRMTLEAGDSLSHGLFERFGKGVPMQAILFVDGRYAACISGRSFMYVDRSRTSGSQMSKVNITLCNMTRWYRFFPGYPDFLIED